MTEKFYKLPQDLAARKDLKASDKILFAVILDYQGNNADCWPGMTTLTRKTGLAKQTVIRSVKRLEKKGVLAVDRRGKGKSNHYKTGTKSRPVPKVDRSINGTIGGAKSRPKPVPKVDPNQTDLLNQTNTNKKFQKPTPSKVTEYAASIGFELDGQYFIDSYEAKGWMIGKSKMKDWKAAVRTWKNRKKEFNHGRKKATTSQRQVKSFAEQKSSVGYSFANT
ncbi:helix-turn-helix domain-containing protein [Candidatus Pacearchaeota archaeon]|nr:helix-turn-helix domain-containing protein [Candidatus Pacearchaeota archaeon]